MERSDMGYLVTADDEYPVNAVPRGASQRWDDTWGVWLVGFYRRRWSKRKHGRKMMDSLAKSIRRRRELVILLDTGSRKATTQCSQITNDGRVSNAGQGLASKRINVQDSRMRRPEQLENGQPIAMHVSSKNVQIHVRDYAVSRTSLLARRCCY